MNGERRKFKRHFLHFQLEIRGNGKNGKPFFEQANLINISGGGALFRSHRIDWYFEHQIVETDILLPGPPDMGGKMKTTATVIGLEQDGDAQVNVSVQFQEPLRLFRTGEQQSDVDNWSAQVIP